MSNSVQRMAEAGEKIRKLGFCMAVVFAGMLVAFAALVVYVIWYAVANVASVDSLGVVTLLNGGCIVIPSGLCLALVVGISLVVLCGISRNISRGVSPFTKAHVRLIRVLALAFAVNAVVSLVGAYGSVNLTIGGLELYIVPHSFVIEICQGATFDTGSFIGAVVCLFISAIWSYASLLQGDMSYLIIELETQLLKTGKTSADLIRATGHTPANISKLRNGKIKAIRLKTLLDICDELDCQPGDIIQRVSEKELEELIVERAKNVVRQMRDGGGNEASLPTSVFAVDLSDE